MFSGCPSASRCVRPCLRPVSTLSRKPKDEISLTLVHAIVEATDDLIRC